MAPRLTAAMAAALALVSGCVTTITPDGRQNPLAPVTRSPGNGAAELRMTVVDGPAVPATLYLALFDTAEGYTSNRALASRKVALRDGSAQLVFGGLPPGRYVIKSFADENGNGRLDTNIVGLPTERYGFSNDARGMMGPPSFDAAAVRLDADGAITLRLR